jgi:alkylation response protein AidB-like acyl-CoA dehydrogenase
MDFSLTKSQKEIVKAAWAFAKGEFDKEQILDLSRNQEFPKDILQKAGDLGFIGIHFPESCEGGGMGLFENVLVAEAFCRKDSTLGSALMFTGYAAECLIRSADDEMRTKILPRVAGGEMILTGAFQELGAGYELSRVQTSALQNSGEWNINGAKTFVPFGTSAGAYVVLCAAETEHGDGLASLFLVEADRKGVHASDAGEKLGGRLMPFADVNFDDVVVPPDNLIGKPGDGAAILAAFLCENRIQIAGMALGTAQGAFDRAMDYVKQREQFGRKLAQFQITRHKLADMAAKIETARYLTYYAAWSFDNGKPETRLASMAKLTATRAAVEVCDEAIQLLGGYGYTTEYEVEHFFRDAKQAQIFQGGPSVLKDIIADEIIGKLK